MMRHRITIERAENGYTVRASDPEIVEQNEKSEGTYRDPDREYVFETRDNAMAWVQENLDKMLPEVKDDYGKAFSDMTEEKSDG